MVEIVKLWKILDDMTDGKRELYDGVLISS
jgi:hypothetical protein